MGLIRLLQLALLAVLVWFGVRTFRRWMRNKRQAQVQAGRRPSSRQVMDVMVQDPQCGTYLPRRDAVRAWVKGQEQFFCSKACRDACLAGKEPAKQDQGA